MSAGAATGLAGRTALVTGGGTGIGAAVARELAARGARVVLVGRSPERLETVATSVRESGGEALALPGDVRELALLDALDAVCERVDVLVGNAAVFAPYAPLEDVALADITDVLEVDLAAALRLARHVLGGMKARGWGRIVHVGSVAGSLGAANQVAYSTAKAGLEGLTRAVAVEAARFGVTCNLVEPGLVGTERALANISAATRADLTRATPAARPGTPQEIAHAVAFLASDAAAAITGATLPLDGGIGLR